MKLHQISFLALWLIASPYFATLIRRFKQPRTGRYLVRHGNYFELDD
nr:hypothetical protein [uncultured bacterium]